MSSKKTITSAEATPEVEFGANFTDLEGHELFYPPHALRPSSVMRMMTVMGLDDLDALEGLDELDVNTMADVVRYVEDTFVKDQEAFDEYCATHSTMEALSLVLAFVGEAAGGMR